MLEGIITMARPTAVATGTTDVQGYTGSGCLVGLSTRETVGSNPAQVQVRDARLVASVTTTNSDATISFSASAITAADIGKYINGTGISAGTKILSITDTTHAEMTADATADGTVDVLIGGADGGAILASATVAAASSVFLPVPSVNFDTGLYLDRAGTGSSEVILYLL